MKTNHLVFNILIYITSIAASSQNKNISLELAPIFQGQKISVPIYFNEKWSVGPYFLISQRNLNAYNTSRDFFDNIQPTVFKFFGVRLNKDFDIENFINLWNIAEHLSFRWHIGFNYEILTEDYFGATIKDQMNPTIGIGLKWKIEERFLVFYDFDVIRFSVKSSDDTISNWIIKNNLIDGEVGEYTFDSPNNNEIVSLTLGIIYRPTAK